MLRISKMFSKVIKMQLWYSKINHADKKKYKNPSKKPYTSPKIHQTQKTSLPEACSSCCRAQRRYSMTKFWQCLSNTLCLPINFVSDFVRIATVLSYRVCDTIYSPCFKKILWSSDGGSFSGPSSIEGLLYQYQNISISQELSSFP